MTPPAADPAWPRRGEVWRIAFDPAIAGEIKKTRPAIIVSNDAANRVLNRLQVVPVSSRVARLYPSEALVTVAGKPAKAVADQLTTASRQRLRGYVGQIDADDMAAVERVIKLQLDL